MDKLVTLPPDDPRHAALQRLNASRQRLDHALTPSSSPSTRTAAGWRSMRRLLRTLLMGSGWGQAGALAGERLTPWVRRHPLWALGLAAASGAGLFLARGWLMGAARLQALRWWQTGQALLLQQSLDPAWLERLLAALPSQAQPPADANESAPSETPESEPAPAPERNRG